MSSIDQQFVEYVVKSLVSKPDAVTIERRIDEKGVLLELTVDPEDLGRVIGKRGATAQSLRTLLRALGTKNDARYNLKIVDNGEPRPSYGDEPRSDSRQDDAPTADAGYAQANDDNTVPQPPPSSSSSSDDPDEDLVESVLEETEPEHSDVVSKTRKELEDLDDLDV